ncbi:hypothetical protein SDC9_65588 [bioreactor metagenome]|uniref:Uncharacterized protein n=1 Tax=bioreactor metagenome TaxID=1076179 RepID=A0A644XSE5_9ZZZZ
MLLRPQLLEGEGLPRLQIGKRRLLDGGFLVAPFLINSGKARKFKGSVGGPEDTIRRGYFDGYAVIDGRSHLAGEKAAPDQLVEAELIAG